MTISGFAAYVKQLWKNKPDTSTPLSAERLLHIEEGIKGNSDAIEANAAAVVSQIVNDPDKIASMAALYALSQKIGDTSKLPSGAADVVAAITQQNSNLDTTDKNFTALKSALGTMYWSGVESISAPGNTVWVQGKKKITLPAGTYIITAHADLPASESNSASMRIYNVTQNTPLSAVEAIRTISFSSYTRRGGVTTPYVFTSQTELCVSVVTTTAETASMCEICAVRIK